MKHWTTICLIAVTFGFNLAAPQALRAEGLTPIKEVLAQVDPATGKPKTADASFTIQGILAVKTVLKNQTMVGFVLNPGEPAIPVMASASETSNLATRSEIKLTGKLVEGPLGTGLKVTGSDITLIATNKPFGLSELRGADFFKDASSLAGRYVQVTNVTLAAGKISSEGMVEAKSASGDTVKLMVSQGSAGEVAPTEPVNAFGIPVKVNGEWRLVAARLLSGKNKEMQNLAQQKTCFTCHNPDMRLVGPSYREVAARYRHDPEAVTKMISQMEKGGSGKWGPVAMPPLAATVSAADRQALAQWIMSYRWDALLSE